MPRTGGGMSSTVLGTRATDGRCVQCNHECVTAWLCSACAITGGIYREPDEYRRAQTATAIGRARNLAQGDAIAYAMWIDLISAPEGIGAPSHRRPDPREHQEQIERARRERDRRRAESIRSARKAAA